MELGDGKIAGKYALGPKIGSGSFGQVYLVNNYGTQQIYALKKQDEKTRHLQLHNESKILRNLQGLIGFPKIHWNGSEYKSNLMVIDLLGPSIENLSFICNKKFSLKTVLMLADQFIQRIETLHSKDYIHRDIKPQNFLMGLSKKTHIVHLIDFGLSKKYRDSKTHQHIPYKENKNLTGTARYASINAHLGIQQSRRDDLQSVGYVLIYLLQGHLPWQGVRANNKIEKCQKIMQKKMSIPVQLQCRNLPIQFSIYLNYCRSMKFEDKPNYNYLRNLFLDLMEKNDYTYDFQYDWCSLNQQKEIEYNKIKIQIRRPLSVKEEINYIIEEDLIEVDPKSGKSLDNKVDEINKDEIIEDGEQNIRDIEGSQQNFMTKNSKSPFMKNLQQKKDKLLYDQ